MSPDVDPPVQPLRSRRVDDAVLFPTLRRPDIPDRLLMGVFDAAGDLVAGSLLDRRSGERGAAMPEGELEVDPTAALPEGIYCGVLYHHFGHFLLESLARLWFARQQPDAPLVWAGAGTWKTGMRLRPWQQDILDVLGVTNPTIIATRPTPVGRLHMPDIGYRYDDRFHPQHAEFLAAYHGPPQDDAVKVWLSRSAIAKDVRDLNAVAIERRLSDAGWTITHPEQQSIREQLDTMARAGTIAGEEGSAFHTLMLLHDVAGKKFHIMRRLGPEHRNLHTVGDARGVDQEFHTLQNQVVVKASGRYVTKATTDPTEILDVLGVPIAAQAPGATDADAAAIVQRVAHALAATSYLEVGVDQGSAVPLTRLPRRVAVSARLPVDPRAYAAEDVRFVEMPLDLYLACVADPWRYDVIRVSAPSAGHGLRAVCASQALAHQGTVWLVDPPPDPAESDLFLLQLHDLMPSLVLRRFTHDGIPRIVASRGVDEAAEPAESIEAGGGQGAGQSGDLGSLEPDEIRARVARFDTDGLASALRSLPGGASHRVVTQPRPSGGSPTAGTEGEDQAPRAGQPGRTSTQASARLRHGLLRARQTVQRLRPRSQRR